MTNKLISFHYHIIAALLLFVSSAHAITWEDRGGEAIRLGVVTATTATPTGTYYSVTGNGVIAESRDGGMTWAPVSLPQSGIHFNSVKFFDDTHGVAVGDGSLAYINGSSWQVVPRPGTKMNAVDMSDGNTAHIACDGSILVFTLSTGVFSKASVKATKYNSVSFHDGVGYACGDGGIVAKYTDGEWNILKNPDGGEDWVVYVLRTSGNLTHIVANDRQTAYAMTADGRLIKTIDGGLSWSERESGTGKGISSMSLIPGGDIAITGDGGRTYRLSDGTDRYSVRYYYDELGRIAASQTSRQQAMNPQRYSYICYDPLGRTVEAGEIEAQNPPTQSLMRSPEYPGNWGGRREQVVHTFYDKPQYASVTARFEEGVQENLRNRISSVIYMDEYDSEMLKYDYATHYSYDIHGNVKELLQEDRKLAAYGDDYAFHSIRYDYDLISGNVNEVHYQNGQPDQFSMYYEYDSENRIQTVKSQFPNEQPKQDASYEYYRHGPLARTVLGDGVQGMDYAYTLQGWVKGMNSDELGNDMGGDGKNGVARDVVGYTLGYNSNDYKPIAKGQTADFYRAVSEQDMTNLYTGNITRMATALANPHLEEKNWTQVRDFRYDVLNRLKSSKVVNSKTSADAHATTYSYDANGNITELTRNNANGDNFDKLTYRYEQDAEGNFINNRLLHVRDNADKPNVIETDIKDQGAFAQNDPSKRNYAYDQQGNLISDKAEEIAHIEWTATGKVRRITRTTQSIKPNLEFRYDALGNRVSKTVISKTDGKRTTTYYVRDAKGTTLATYTESDGELRLSEQHLYGAKRLGMRSSNLLVASTNGGNSIQEEKKGEKRYELTNHLGNVLAVVSGEKKDGSAQILSITDYYPFGMEMDGRKYSKLTADGGYRYGFTGHEKEYDLSNDVFTTDYRLLDARIGRWLSVDPLAQGYPDISPYVSVVNNPICFVDINGQWVAKFKDDKDWTQGVILIAEKGDNVKTLSIQLGLPYDQLVEKSFAGKDPTLKKNFRKGRTFTSDELPGVEAFTAINEFLKGVTKENTNCARLVLGVNGIQSPQYNEDSGYKSIAIAVKKATTENNRTAETAQIGDMVTYQFHETKFIELLEGEGLLYELWTDRSIPKEQAYHILGKQAYAKKKSVYDLYFTDPADHFSVILLRTQDGKGIQQILEKNGESDVNISPWYEKNEAFQVQPPSTTDHKSPIYHINGKN